MGKGHSYVPMGSEQTRRRRATLLRQGGPYCAACGVRDPQGGLTLDHKLARNLGGAHALSNLRLVCEPCNHEKGKREARLCAMEVAA